MTHVHRPPTESSGGTVAVIDACAGIVVGQVRVASAKINYLTLLPDGSVVVFDKAGIQPKRMMKNPMVLS